MSQHNNLCRDTDEELKAKISVPTAKSYVSTKVNEKHLEENRRLSRHNVSKIVFYVATFQNYVAT